MIENMWDYSPQAYSDDQKLDLVGFDVEATDGKIGSVDEENNVVGDSYIVVDTGFWIFGKKVMLPASTVTQIATKAGGTAGSESFADALIEKVNE